MALFLLHRPGAQPQRIQRALKTLALLLWTLGLASCATVGPLPQVDLTDAGWTVWVGQAIWKPRSDRPPLAGDLLIAQHTNRDVLVSFSKSLLPIFTAQTAGGLWRIDFVERGRSYSGRGRPPDRFVWFRLPYLIAGASAPKNWEIDAAGSGEWSIINDRTGETIKLVLDR